MNDNSEYLKIIIFFLLKLVLILIYDQKPSVMWHGL